MSLETWKKKYYPKDAGVTDISEALKHSIRKWDGLKKHVLDEHELVYEKIDGGRIRDTDTGETLEINAESCSLCFHHQREVSAEVNDFCGRCPLYLSRDRKSCDKQVAGEDMPPYEWFQNYGDPQPMITALRKAKNHKPE